MLGVSKVFAAAAILRREGPPHGKLREKDGGEEADPSKTIVAV